MVLPKQGDRMNIKTSIARWVSIIGHPFVLIILMVLSVCSARGMGAGAFRIAAIVTVAGLIPSGIFMWRRHATGRWQTVDASSPKDRPAAYLAAFVILTPISLYFLFVEPSSDMFRGTVAFALMLGAAAAFNRWIKLSLHMAFDVFAGLILAKISLAYGLAILIFVPLIGWSRVALARHTAREVIGGCALGVVVAIITLWPYL
jgi:hypothetical protein